MLDQLLAPRISSFADNIADKLAASGLRATTLTFMGLALGLTGCFFVAMQIFIPGLVFILLAKGFDILDAAVARKEEATEKTAFWDEFSDLLLYAAFLFFFALAMPSHALGACFMLFAYGTMVTAYLLHKGPGGLIGHTEMTIFIILCCLFPSLFSGFTAVFGLLCFVTAFLRVRKYLAQHQD